MNHGTPSPTLPDNIRGEFGAINSVVPGMSVGELMPLTAACTDRIAALRAVVTKDQAHSSSGYQMLTGVPHIPLSRENVTAKAPNLAPSWAAMARALFPDQNGLPSSIVLPRNIANDGEIVWPGQTAGVLGLKYNPWTINCDPSAADFAVPDITLPKEVASDRFLNRRRLLDSLNQTQRSLDQMSGVRSFSRQSQQAFDLVLGAAGQKAFELQQETDQMRDRYGRDRFGQSMLLARRLVESGVRLVQVNWTRVPGGDNNGTWDTHANHCGSLKNLLMPMMDRTYSALIEDLSQKGLLDETLVVWIGEFGHTPKINARAGRDHWGNCFSIAMAGGGIRGGIIHGESDAHAAYPVGGVVTPQDIAATIFHCLGFTPETSLTDQTNRPIPLSRGNAIGQLLV